MPVFSSLPLLFASVGLVFFLYAISLITINKNRRLVLHPNINKTASFLVGSVFVLMGIGLEYSNQSTATPIKGDCPPTKILAESIDLEMMKRIDYPVSLPKEMLEGPLDTVFFTRQVARARKYARNLVAQEYTKLGFSPLVLQSLKVPLDTFITVYSWQKEQIQNTVDGCRLSIVLVFPPTPLIKIPAFKPLSPAKVKPNKPIPLFEIDLPDNIQFEDTHFDRAAYALSDRQCVQTGIIAQALLQIARKSKEVAIFCKGYTDSTQVSGIPYTGKGKWYPRGKKAVSMSSGGSAVAISKTITSNLALSYARAHAGMECLVWHLQSLDPNRNYLSKIRLYYQGAGLAPDSLPDAEKRKIEFHYKIIQP